MAASLNRVCLIGNLTRDPELRSTAGGLSICSLRIAVNDRRKVGEEWKDVAGYFDVTVFGAQGENVAKFVSKGKPIGVDGKLSYREWTTDDGSKRNAVEIIADSVQFLGGRDESSAPNPATEPEF